MIGDNLRLIGSSVQGGRAPPATRACCMRSWAVMRKLRSCLRVSSGSMARSTSAVADQTDIRR